MCAGLTSKRARFNSPDPELETAIDLRTGSANHWLDLGGDVRELYDVQILPGVRCPTALGTRSKEVWATVTHEEGDRWVRHTGIVEE